MTKYCRRYDRDLMQYHTEVINNEYYGHKGSFLHAWCHIINEYELTCIFKQQEGSEHQEHLGCSSRRLTYKTVDMAWYIVTNGHIRH